MGKSFLVLLSLVWLAATAAFGQAVRRPIFVDAGLSASHGNFSAALSASALYGVAIEHRFKIGYGIRFTGFVAVNKYYTTAPSKFTSPVQGPGTIFSKNIDQNIDTITTATGSTNSLNASLYLQYTVTSKFDIGFNIDVIGASFGKQRQFNIISSSFDANQRPVQAGSPTRFNLLLTSDNDIGSLNSEAYVRYWVTHRIGVRAGYTFLFSEYRTHDDLSFNQGQIMNDRYRYKARMALVAVTVKLFND